MNIVKGFLQVGLGTVINILLSLFTTPIITRIVDPIDYGKFQMFTTYTGIVASFLYFGLNDSLYRFFYTYDNDKEKSSLLKLCLCLPITISIIASVAGIILFKINLIKIDYSMFLFVLLCLNSIVTVWNTIAMGMLQNTKQSNIYSISIVIQKLIYCLLSIILIKKINDNHLLVLVIVTILSYIISILIGVKATNKFWNLLKVRFPKNTKEIIKYSLPIYMYFIIYSIYDVVDKLIVENNFNDYEVGIYTSAFSIVGMFAIVQTAFYVIWRPIQTESYTTNENDKTLIQKGNRYMTIIMYFIGINVIMFKDILILFLGEKYRGGVGLIPFLIFNPIMNVLIVTVISGIEVSKKSYLRTIIISLSLIIQLLISKFFMSKFALYGIAISVALSLIIQYFLTLYFSNKFYYIDYGVSKMLIITTVTMLLAIVSAFMNNKIIEIVLYIISMLVLYFLYKNDLKDMFNKLIESLNKKGA